MKEAFSKNLKEIRLCKKNLTCIIIQFNARGASSINKNLSCKTFNLNSKLIMTEIYPKDVIEIHSFKISLTSVGPKFSRKIATGIVKKIPREIFDKT